MALALLELNNVVVGTHLKTVDGIFGPKPIRVFDPIRIIWRVLSAVDECRRILGLDRVRGDLSRLKSAPRVRSGDDPPPSDGRDLFITNNQMKTLRAYAKKKKKGFSLRFLRVRDGLIRPDMPDSDDSAAKIAQNEPEHGGQVAAEAGS